MDEELRRNIFSFAYGMAFRDATMRKAFSFKATDERKNDFENIKSKLKSKLKDVVANYISEILDGNATEETCDYYIKTIYGEACGCFSNSDNCFSHGNAQKLVNMSAKYMYLSCYADEFLRDRFKFCHCPMDGIILKKVIELVQINNTLNEEYIINSKWQWNTVAWSTIMFDENCNDPYHQFQKMVKRVKDDNKFPLEFDYMYFDS